MELIKGIVFLVALSLDAVAISFAYGLAKVYLPISRVIIMNIVSSVVFYMSLIFGNVLREILAASVLKWICFSILIMVGIWKIVQDMNNKEERKSSHITFIEAIGLGILLSIDGMMVGTAMAMLFLNPIYMALMACVIGCFAMFLGNYIGLRVQSKTSLSIGWLGGVILIILAFVGII